MNRTDKVVRIDDDPHFADYAELRLLDQQEVEARNEPKPFLVVKFRHSQLEISWAAVALVAMFGVLGFLFWDQVSR